MPGGRTPRMKAAATPMRLTAALVALVERLEPDPGPDPGTTEPADADFAATVADLLRQPARSRPPNVKLMCCPDPQS
jgi:hypothetical protein